MSSTFPSSAADHPGVAEGHEQGTVAAGGGFGFVMRPRKKRSASKPRTRAASPSPARRRRRATSASPARKRPASKKTVSKKKRSSAASSPKKSKKGEWKRTAQKVLYKGEKHTKWVSRVTGECAVRRAKVSADGKRKYVFRRV